jgi:hypothetical protein
MAIEFDQIEASFRQLRDFILHDLERIVDQEIGGNYAATAIIVCAHDSIANLRDGKANAGERPFAETLPEEWRPVAPSLYDALRNGLVRAYEPQRLVINGHEIGLGLSWRQRAHKVAPSAPLDYVWYELEVNEWMLAPPSAPDTRSGRRRSCSR